MQHLPPFIAPSEHPDADSALAQIQHIYQHSVNHLRQAMREFVAGADMAGTRVRAFYPFVRVLIYKEHCRGQIDQVSLKHFVNNVFFNCHELLE